MDVFKKAPIENLEIYKRILSKYNLQPNTMVSVLPFRDKVGRETRNLYYHLAIDEDTGRFSNETKLSLSEISDKDLVQHMPTTRLFSFGECNALCPYCKRDMQFIDSNGVPMATGYTSLENLFGLAEAAVRDGEIVRFSGGDPVLFPKICYAIGEYINTVHGAFCSIAHNGSGVGFVRKLLPYMSCAAIDIKAPIRYYHTVLGLSEREGKLHFNNAVKCHALFNSKDTNPNGAILDIRTPIFGAHEDPNVPQTSLSDMMELGAFVSQNDPSLTFWTWRLYKEVVGCEWTVPNVDDVLLMIQKVSEAYPNHWMGVRAKWHGGGMMYFKGGKHINRHHEIDTFEKAGSGNTGECV